MPPPPPLSLTPQSLKRKLQEISDINRRTVDSDTNDSDNSSLRSSPELSRGDDCSPFRISHGSSPTKSIRTANIIHSTANSSSVEEISNLQVEELHKFFAKRVAPFPLELLKPTVLTELFLKGWALERYFQRRLEGIKEDSGLKPLQKPFVRSSPPSVPFPIYLERLFRYGHPEPLHLLAIVAYSERLIKICGVFVPPTGWHRFVVAGWIVAGKALLGDQYWTNLYWARVAGISVQEICALERELIGILHWHLQVQLDELTAAWYLIQL